MVELSVIETPTSLAEVVVMAELFVIEIPTYLMTIVMNLALVEVMLCPC